MYFMGEVSGIVSIYYFCPFYILFAICRLFSQLVRQDIVKFCFYLLVEIMVLFYPLLDL